MPSARKLRLPLLVLVLTLGSGTGFWVYFHRQPARDLTLYGNVDIREVQSAFEDSGRLLDIRVQEGDAVTQGQVLAELDPVRFRETAQRARAEVAAAQAALDNAEATARRQAALAHKQFAPKQSLDNAEAALRTARANRDRARAELALAEKALADTVLKAPEAGVVENRILEPGDMASPQAPVLTLALDNPIWIRAYLAEPRLGQVRAGMPVWVQTDSFPGQRLQGWVGTISPTAEFTPKSVETTELRTELMYRLRVFVCNPDHRLRLGMPATVVIPLPAPDPLPPRPANCGP
ncbi:MAG: efflux RND transporter periplasmic adaptor subunit [Betaproteobacteria bacterium]|nr:efflux RND transporter periplasmic adaptor subunit [Betaproteobacteria bacterium]MDE2623028.1 efflux RND transporter periplasmic adaptor subunit [Betaproteobacteria bacterium]